MVPPHDRPTFQAVSSATPNSSIFDLPLSMTSRASVTTAPSTQPPDTEPRKLPSWSMTRLDPTGRGAEPQVSTTVASATPRPCRRQSSAALRMSSSRASMGNPPLYPPEYGPRSPARQCQHSPDYHVVMAGLVQACPGHDDVVSGAGHSRHALQPRLRVAAAAGAVGQRRHQFGHGVERVDRPELVHVRQ